MTMEMKVRPWLLIILAAVILVGGGFTWWYLKSGKSTTNVATSPTPTKSTAISPSASGNAKTSTPSGGGATATPTPTPTPTPPAGWKVEKNQVGRGQDLNAWANYQVFIKDSWSIVYGGNALWQQAQMLYGTDPACKFDSYGGSLDNCLFSVGISTSSTGKYSYPAGQNAHGVPVYLSLGFNDARISSEDKQIVINSFTYVE